MDNGLRGDIMLNNFFIKQPGSDQVFGNTGWGSPNIGGQKIQNLLGAYQGLNAGTNTYNHPKTASDSLQNNQFIQEFLRGLVSGDNGLYSKQRQVATSDINQVFDRNRRYASENLAQSGLSRSGIGSVISSMLAGQQANAIAKSDVNIGQNQLNAKQRAIQQLLGLDSESLQANLGQQRIGLGQQNIDLGRSKLEELKREYNDQSTFNFWRDAFPGIMKLGGSIALAPVTGGGSLIGDFLS